MVGRRKEFDKAEKAEEARVAAEAAAQLILVLLLVTMRVPICFAVAALMLLLPPRNHFCAAATILAALVRAGTEALGIQALLKDFGISVKLTILSDATAAIGIVKRVGLGKVRHLSVADLWVQEK